MTAIYCVGIDLGGTTIKAGIVDEDYRIVKSGAIPTITDRGAEKLIQDMAELVSVLLKEAEISMDEVASVGVGVPGTANKKTGIMEYANNRSLVMVTLGTGIGGAMILDGKLYEGCNFAAGEFGHFVIQCEGEPCNCGRRGCFETYASATGLIRMAKQAMETEEGRKSSLWNLCSGETDGLNAEMIFKAAKKGDLTAGQTVERYLYYLSVGITDIINIFQPEILCIGGGVSRAGNQLLDPLKRMVDQQIYTRDSQVKTEIVTATLGNDAGIIGAAMLDD